jgi:ABC-2 type transport system ATP-binding protein
MKTKETRTKSKSNSKFMAETAEPIIEVQGLTRTFKTYKRKQGFKAVFKSIFKREKVIVNAVDNISFTINKGEMVGFVGPNGAGKSTTIKAMTGILYPTSGIVHVLDYIPWAQRKKYVKNIGVVFGQKTQLWLDLPPLDAFYLNKRLYSIPDTEFKERLDTMVKILNVQEIMQRPTRNLSLGERMKCEFIMALLHNPPVLFLDEPTIGVDAIAKDEIREFLKFVNAKYKTTFILTTHDMDDIEELCNRIIIIDHGKIIYDGSINKVKQRYIKWRTVDIEFGKITDRRKFNSLIKKGELQVDKEHYKSIKFEKRKVNIPETLQKLMNCCEVIDISVHEPRLDHVIKEIYTDKSLKSKKN